MQTTEMLRQQRTKGFANPTYREIVKLAGRQPFLTKPEEQALIKEAQRTNSPALRKKIGTIYLRTVVQLASYYYKKNTGAEIMAFIQAGSQGLMEAIEKYKPATNNRFVTCAWWWIRIRIQHEIALHNSVVTPKHGGDTRDLVQRRTVSFESLHPEPDLNEQAVEDILRDSVAEPDLHGSPERAAYDHEIRTAMRDLFKVCRTPMERSILAERIYAEKATEATPLERLGERNNCSRETVRKTELVLRKRLRRHIEDTELVAA